MAKLYLERVERVAALDAKLGGALSGGARREPSAPWSLTEATARGLALWMSFEDTSAWRSQDPAARFERVRDEIRAAPGTAFGITIKFMKPRVAEIAGTMPAASGPGCCDRHVIARGLQRFTGGKQVRTGTV